MSDPIPAGTAEGGDVDLAAIKADLDRARTILQRLCNGQERWRMSIPAKPDSDPDLILAQALRGGEELLAEVVRLRAEAAQTRAIAEEAIRDLGGQHTGHWDPTGHSGRGCPKCQDDRDLKARLRARLAALSHPAKPS